ncbi:response regulator [Actinokineospora enzanensis]|uniref:response regulator n=1 Tax=Actinokineospora enzanensis TaxID=155975 RepID=UPI00036C0039|nr:response regulator [Actinokineospora enzanensis]
MADRVITAVVVDDHSVVAAGVRSWCERASPPITVIDARAKLVDVWTGPGATADVVVLDLQLTGPCLEFAVLGRLAKEGRKVVVYTASTDKRIALRCLDSGALGFVTKREGEQHLVAAIHAAADGRLYLPPALSGAIASNTDPTRPRLSEMELCALRAWFAAPSKQSAARRLNVSTRTLSTYLERVRVKYTGAGRSAPTKAELLARGLEDGWLLLDDLPDH